MSSGELGPTRPYPAVEATGTCRSSALEAKSIPWEGDPTPETTSDVLEQNLRRGAAPTQDGGRACVSFGSRTQVSRERREGGPISGGILGSQDRLKVHLECPNRKQQR
ncbi:hypothetical protein NDU88_002436 [Pleurodeles waltl]|uniref:Uncharacterized protein n=1 Tax=Pleurodeles waltl TaxID=8319 RepID=A0AAV7LPA7_PLEWA|nr:hypothetical protein NDU88_002436 [Pleurodeles waltl]